MQVSIKQVSIKLGSCRFRCRSPSGEFFSTDSMCLSDSQNENA